MTANSNAAEAEQPASVDCVSRLVDHWLSTMDADDPCDVLRLHPKHLRPIIAARCKRRPRKVLLKSSRECDPCVCGWAGGWHTECYWWFSRHTKQPATETFALPWRKSFQVNAEVRHGAKDANLD